MEKVEIDKDKPLSPGDIIEMHFVTTGMVWLTATHIALIEWRLEDRKDFRVLSHSLPANNRVIFEIKIIEPAKEDVTVQEAGIAVTAATIAKVIGALAVVGIFYLTLDKVYQIMESPAGKVGVAGVGALGVAAAIAIVLFLLPRGK